MNIELTDQIKNLEKNLVVTVPYRDREFQYKIFLNHIKTYFNDDKLDKFKKRVNKIFSAISNKIK